MPEQKLVELRGPDGATASISTFGATVTSYKTSKGVEKLFMSSTSPIDGPNPICGGIPIVWPTFGDPPKRPPFERLSLHGFAHSVVWEHTQTGEGEATFSTTFHPSTFNAEQKAELMCGIIALASTSHIKEKYYEPGFKLIYRVKVCPRASDDKFACLTALHKLLPGDGLESQLTVENPSSASEDLEFHALLHNYFLLLDGQLPSDVKVAKALQGKPYIDKTRDFQQFTDKRVNFTYEGFTDSIYIEAPTDFDIELGNASRIAVHTERLPNLTTWNPARDLSSEWKEFEPDSWKRFVCIEPGQVTDFIKLPPGKDWTCIQRLTFS